VTRLQSRTLVVAALVIACVVLLLLNQTGQLNGLKSLLTTPLTALQRGVSGLTAGVRGLFQPSSGNSDLEARVAELEARVIELEAENVRLRENETDLQLLSGLLDYARSQPDNRYEAANVIGRDPSAFLSYIVIDLGSDAGLARDMPVVTNQGLVGVIVELNCCAAKVRLVTDPDSAVNARLQASRDEGVAVGRFGGGLELDFLSQQAVVAPGDRVLTSGLGGKFPEGLVIGTVSAVQRQDYEVLQRAILTPGVDFNRLEIVLIITNFRPIDFTPLLQSTPAAPAP
jgi:rod shape-determining protein MreC